MTRWIAMLALGLVAGPVIAQDSRNIPAGNPLGTAGGPSPPASAQTDPAQQPQDALRLRLQAHARAQADAQRMAQAFTFTPPTRDADAGRTTSAQSFTQTIGGPAATRPAASSPYGGYYQIQTPWAPQ